MPALFKSSLCHDEMSDTGILLQETCQDIGYCVRLVFSTVKLHVSLFGFVNNELWKHERIMSPSGQIGNNLCIAN